MRIIYIYEHTHFSGLKETWHFSGCTAEEADAAAVEQGWVPPRWWQWWRRKDRCGVLLENYCALSSGNNLGP